MSTRITGNNTGPTPSQPRDSASLLVVNDRNEVLMIQRTLASRSFAGMHAFPGGNFDETQDLSFEQTAIRETFEETGLLLVNAPAEANIPRSQLTEARKAIHSRSDPLKFPTFLKQHSLQFPNSHLLVPFTEWITPPNAPIRFHARFFVLFLRDLIASGGSLLNANPEAIEGDNVVELPGDDGKLEIVATSFTSIPALFERFEKGEIRLMPPQFYLLTTLQQLLYQRQSSSPDSCTQWLRRLADSHFGKRIFRPQPSGWETPSHGDKENRKRQILAYDGDELVGGSKGARHRSLVTFDAKGKPAHVELQRNIDVFEENAGSGEKTKPRL